MISTSEVNLRMMYKFIFDGDSKEGLIHYSNLHRK